MADLDDRHGRVCSFDLDRLPVGSRIVHESGFHGMVRFLAVGRFVCLERFFVHRFPNVPQRHPSYDASGNLETGRCGSLQGLADVLLRTVPSPKTVSALCRPFHGFPAGRAGHALPSAGPSSLHDRRLRSDQAEAVPPREQPSGSGLRHGGQVGVSGHASSKLAALPRRRFSDLREVPAQAYDRGVPGLLFRESTQRRIPAGPSRCRRDPFRHQ